jgi:hypothetical protein
MLELKKVTTKKEEKRAHICLPCLCFPKQICDPIEPLVFIPGKISMEG